METLDISKYFFLYDSVIGIRCHSYGEAEKYLALLI